METIDKIVALNIRARRAKLGLSQKDLAEKVKMSPISLNKIEMGSRPAGKNAIVAIAEALGCNAVDLLSPPRSESELTPSNRSQQELALDILKEVERVISDPFWDFYQQLSSAQKNALLDFTKNLLKK